MQKQILIYGGNGASQEGIRQLESAFKTLLCKTLYQVGILSAKALLQEPWEQNTALFILPGGADIPYTQDLNGKGNRKILSYLEEGGSFLGICAGSYYAGNALEFAKGTPLEVVGARELSIFPGVVKGPLSAYEPQSLKGAKAAPIVWEGEEGFDRGKSFTLFYNGGGYFEEAFAKKSTNVLASYKKGRLYPAIIECKKGKGSAILSGVHFEYDPFLLELMEKKRVLAQLKKANSDRLALFGHLLRRLKVQVGLTV